MNNTPNLYRDFDHENDLMVHVRETPHGIFRAVVEQDYDAHAPYNDYGCPVFRIERSRWGDDTLRLAAEYGEESWRNDGILYTMSEVWERMSNLPAPGWIDTIDHVDRYLRIFHGGGAKIISSRVHQGGDDFLVYDTRAMREHWGQVGETLETSDPDAEEWQAFLDGEVYGVRVERATEFDMDDEPVEWVEVEDTARWGHYGDDWAAEAALEALDWAIEHAAAQMLPLTNDNNKED